MSAVMGLGAVRLISVLLLGYVELSDAFLGLETSFTEGSDRFKYFSTEADETAKILLAYKKNVTLELFRYVKDLKTSNAASEALEKYNEYKDSLKGTECVSGEDEDRFSGAQENIETIIDMCKDSAPHDDMDELSNVIREALTKVQQADVELLKIAKICLSSREDPPESCEDDKEKALKAIRNTLSPVNVARIKSIAENAFINTKSAIDDCVEEGTKDLKETLKEWIQKLKDCKRRASS